jgi:uncharacterized protein YkwD
MSGRAVPLVFAVVLLSACSGASRPPWADGALVRTERPADAAPQDLADVETRLLALHNRERAAYGSTPLVWDAQLARAAAAYGPELARQGRLVHSPAESRPRQGENLWMGTRDAYSPEDDQVAISPGHGCERPGDVRT